MNEEDAFVTSAGREALAELAKPEPDESIIRRGLVMLKGALAPLVSGMSKGVSAATAEWAETAIGNLVL